MIVIDGGGGELGPDWSQVFSDVLDHDAARAHWLQIVAELKAVETFAEVNRHQVERLVMFRVVHDRAARQVAEMGAVLPPKRGSKTAIARVSPHFDVMRSAASDCDRIEAELGLSPRRRGAAAKVDRKRKGPIGGGFLRSVSGGG